MIAKERKKMKQLR